MGQFKEYNLNGEVVGEASFEPRFLEQTVHPQVVKDYITAVRKNARQWSANTKGRSEIALSNAKPHPQKGTGKARQGCIKVSQYRKGAVVFGPKPKFDQHVRINKKERQKAVRCMMIQKVVNGELSGLNIDNIKSSKTRDSFPVLKFLNIVGKKVLFVSENNQETSKAWGMFYLSMRNVPGMRFMPVSNVSAYDLMRAHHIVAVGSAIKQIVTMVEG